MQNVIVAIVQSRLNTTTCTKLFVTLCSQATVTMGDISNAIVTCGHRAIHYRSACHASSCWPAVTGQQIWCVRYNTSTVRN